MDPISDVFKTMHVASVVHSRLEATAPWGLKPEADAEGGEGKHSAADSAFQFAHFGMLTRGNCWLTVGGMPEALPLAGGDCFLLDFGHQVAVTLPLLFFLMAHEVVDDPLIDAGSGQT